MPKRGFKSHLRAFEEFKELYIICSCLLGEKRVEEIINGEGGFNTRRKSLSQFENLKNFLPIR